MLVCLVLQTESMVLIPILKIYYKTVDWHTYNLAL